MVMNVFLWESEIIPYEPFGGSAMRYLEKEVWEYKVSLKQHCNQIHCVQISHWFKSARLSPKPVKGPFIEGKLCLLTEA